MGVWGSRVWQEREKQKPVPRPAFQIMDPSLDSRRAVLRSRARSFALRSDASRPRSWLRSRESTRRGESYFSLVSAASVSIFLITLHAPLSTVLKRTLDNAFSRLLPTTHNAQPTAILTAREAELAPRSGTGRRRRLACASRLATLELFRFSYFYPLTPYL